MENGLLPSSNATQPSKTEVCATLASFPAGHIQTYCGDQDCALDDVLHVWLDAHQRHPIVQTCHDQGAEYRPKNCSSPAHQTGAANHAGSNRIQFQELTGVGRRAANPRCVDYGCYSGENPHEAKHRQNMSPDIDT